MSICYSEEVLKKWPLLKECLYMEFFWSIFPQISTEYGVQKNTGYKTFEYGTFSRIVYSSIHKTFSKPQQ